LSFDPDSSEVPKYIPFWCKYRQDLVKHPSPKDTNCLLVLTASQAFTLGMSILQTALISTTRFCTCIFKEKKKEYVLSTLSRHICFGESTLLQRKRLTGL